MEKITWKNEIIEVLEVLGEATRDDILNKIIERKRINLSLAKTPKNTISNVLQTYSYSTEYGIEDIFRNVYGVSARKGVWTLVNHKKEQTTIEDITFNEGREIIRKHKARERNPKLKEVAIRRYKDGHNGELYCEVCGFNFLKAYGDIGIDFIEIHHIKPISQMRNDEKTKIEDVAMVCSNCHRMIHRKQPWLSMKELKDIVLNVRQKP